MKRKRVISFIIFIVALSFIVYVVVDNSASDELGSEFTFTNSTESEEHNDNNSLDPSVIEKKEVGLQQGMYAPNFTLPLWGSNEERSLSSFRGKIVVLNLWASWCPPCKKEMPDLIKLYEDYNDKGVEVVGVNMATLEKSEGATDQFMEEFKVPFPTFIDHSHHNVNLRGKVETLYKIRAIPATYILDEEGRIFVVIRGEVNYGMLENQIKQLLE